eukprot:Nk52_evm4s280 gene=Nk52_evmTU4s280
MQTRLTKTFWPLQKPIILAPMSKHSGGRLAGAVANAGGMGLIGAGYFKTKEELWKEWEIALKEIGGKDKGGEAKERLGIGLLSFLVRENTSVFEEALNLKPSFMWFAVGECEDYIQQCKRRKIKTICQVASVAEAVQCAKSGADCIVVQGAEAGGHGTSTSPGLMSFIPLAKDRLRKGAGGISDGRGLAACLALGADGVVIGTRFTMSQESLTSKAAQELMAETVAAPTALETVRSDIWDSLTTWPHWPSGVNCRALRNQLSETYPLEVQAILRRAHDEGDQIITPEMQNLLEAHGITSIQTLRAQFAEEKKNKNYGHAYVACGTSVSLIKSDSSNDGIHNQLEKMVLPAGNIVEETESEALSILSSFTS